MGALARRIADVRQGCLTDALLLVLMVVETADLLFATDSIPAVFAVSTDVFIVYTSNVFAILGLRALYFLVARLMQRLRHLQYGLSAILVFVHRLCPGDWRHHVTHQ